MTCRLLIACALAGAVACGGGEDTSAVSLPAVSTGGGEATSLARLVDGATTRLVDLTHPLSPDSLYWPTGEPFEHERLAWGPSDGGYWYAAAAFSSPEHLGTHLDAPVHFAERGWTSAEIPVDRLVGSGLVIDITDRASTDPDAVLRVEDVTAWEAQHGAVPAAAIVLVRTGWSSRWPDWEDYYGSQTPRNVATLHFPGVSPDAAAALVERRVAGVGIDTASIDPGVDTAFRTHQVLGAANVFNLENLTGLADLPATGFLVLALPMKIADGTGGPARVVAIVERP